MFAMFALSAKELDHNLLFGVVDYEDYEQIIFHLKAGDNVSSVFIDWGDGEYVEYALWEGINNSIVGQPKGRIIRVIEESITEVSFDNFKIDIISVENCKKLQSLDVSNCELKGSYRFDNEFLEYLDVRQNKIESLEINNAFYLKDLRCSYNRLHELNLSNQAELEYLDCSYNNIDTLYANNISENATVICNNNSLKISTYTESKLNIESLSQWDIGEQDPINLTLNNDLKDAFTLGDTIDLSSEYKVTDTIAGITYYTRFVWKNVNQVILKKGIDYDEISKGKFVFKKTQERSVYCVMENDALYMLDKSLKKQNVLFKTTSVNIFAPLALVITGNPGELLSFSMIFDPLSDTTEIRKIDWGNSNALDIASEDTTEFNRLIGGNGIVKIYASDIISVDFENNSSIQALDVSRAEDLIDLKCENNEIKKLDLSKNLNLQAVSCIGNNIDTLIINSEKISRILCEDNSLNFIQYPELINNEITIFCGKNNLSISKMPEPEYIKDSKIESKKQTNIPIKTKTIGEQTIIDFSEEQYVEYNGKTYETKFEWFENNDKISESEYSIQNGICTFNSYYSDSIHCRMTNEAFPGWTFKTKKIFLCDVKADFELEDTACSPFKANLINKTDTLSDADVLYSWNFGDGNDTVEVNPVHTFSALHDITYSITLTAKSNSGCINSKTKDIRINRSPKADFELDSSSANFLYPQNIITAIGKNNTKDELSYSWSNSFNEEISSNEVYPFTLPITAPSNNIIAISLKATLNNGCENKKEQEFTMKELPKFETKYEKVNSTIHICEGDSIKIEVDTKGFIVEKWIISTPKSTRYIEDTLPFMYVSDAGIYSAILTIKGTRIKEFSTPFELFVDKKINRPQLQFVDTKDNEKKMKLTKDDEIVICNYPEYLLTVKDTARSYVYHWFNGNDEELSQEKILKIENSGEYYVKVENVACVDISESIYIDIIENISKPKLVAKEKISEKCFDLKPVQLTVDTDNEFDVYTWFKNNEIIDARHDKTRSFVIRDKEEYFVEASFGDLELCKIRTDKFSINYLQATAPPNINFFMPEDFYYLQSSYTKAKEYVWYRDGVKLEYATEYFLPVGDTIGTYVVGVKDLNDKCYGFSEELDLKKLEEMVGIHSDDSYFTVFPNPATSQVTIECSNPVIGKSLVSITDVYGREIIKYSAAKLNSFTTLNIPLKNISSGVYFVKYIVNGVIFTDTIMVE